MLARKLALTARWNFRDRFARVRDDPIFILGNQKSGTTAIAKLLVAATGETYSHDMFSSRDWRDTDALLRGETPVRELIRRGRREFAYWRPPTQVA